MSCGAHRPRRAPAKIADPPVGSASTRSTGRGQVHASPVAVVVTPGDPDADVNTINATAQRSRESKTITTRPVAARAASGPA